VTEETGLGEVELAIQRGVEGVSGAGSVILAAQQLEVAQEEGAAARIETAVVR
jgi:hypothetical protein